VLLAAAGVAQLALAFELACLWRVRHRRLPEPTGLPSCSILKPLTRLEDDLEQNLESHLEQDYRGAVELLLGINPGAPAEPVARSFAARYPDRVRVVLHEEKAGLNPKVNQLIALMREAKHELIACTDATIRVRPEWLRETVAALERPGVGLATHLLAGTGERRLGAAWDNQALVTFVSPNVAVAATIGMDQVVGKAFVLPRRVLDDLGGFQAFKDALGEDQLLGRGLARLGLHSHVCPTPVLDVAVERSLREFGSRHTRWSIVRFRLVRPGAFLEPLLNPTLLALSAVGCAPAHERARVARLATYSIATSMLFTHACARLTRGHGFSAKHLILLPFQQLAFFAIWTRGATKRSVTWQGHRRRVGADTRMSAGGS
jgi:ceramide glucosyltransferase